MIQQRKKVIVESEEYDNFKRKDENSKKSKLNRRIEKKKDNKDYK